MSGNTGIEWTGETWNPTTGCDRISTGCDHCFAMTWAKRLKAMGAAKYQNDGDPRTSGPGFALTVHPDTFLLPLKWKTPRRVFVNSMSDLAHARVNDETIAHVFATMSAASQHEFQLLTKRPRRLRKLLCNNDFRNMVANARHALALSAELQWPIPNVGIGVSIESDDYCWRADELRGLPAAMRFLSCEPLLGPLTNLDLAEIDWVIVGGESGPNFRPLDLAWARDLRDRCQERPKTAFFFKQVGGPTSKSGGRLLDGRLWEEYPLWPESDTAKEVTLRNE